MFTFGVPLHGKSPYIKSLLLVEKKQDFVIRAGYNHRINGPRRKKQSKNDVHLRIFSIEISGKHIFFYFNGAVGSIFLLKFNCPEINRKNRPIFFWFKKV